MPSMGSVVAYPSKFNIKSLEGYLDTILTALVLLLPSSVC